jgi:hypothetical protein
MRLRITLGVFLLAAVASGAGRKFEFRYVLGSERNGAVVPANPLSAFETGDRLRLRLMPSQESYCYVAIGRSDGRFELIPEPQTAEYRRPTPAGSWVELPDSGWLRLDQKPGIEMLYLIVTSTPVREIEELRSLGRFSESALLKIRDLYQSGVASDRAAAGELVRVRHETHDDRPIVVLEPIRLRHR